MIQLNLLPDLKKEYLKSQKTKALVITISVMTAIGALGITVLIAIYAFAGQQLQLTLISNDIKSKTTQLGSVSDLGKYLTIQNQLQALPQLHTGKGVYSRLFDMLPVLNPLAPNNIKLSALQMTQSTNSIVLTGTTATYQALNVFADTLSNAQFSYKAADSSSRVSKIFKTVSVDGSSLAQINGKKTVSFSISTTYDPAVFDATNGSVAISVPNITTTPSITGAPAVFGGSGGGK